jgi:ABC-type sugar transport system ATPase subunit
MIETTEQPVIEAEGLVKRFGDLRALAGVDLRVPAGGVLGLLVRTGRARPPRCGS